MKTDEKNPQDWLFLARERLQAADALFQALGATYSGVELLQEPGGEGSRSVDQPKGGPQASRLGTDGRQSVERFLKA